MWFKLYSFEKFYKIRKAEINKLKKNDSRFLEKRILAKSSNLNVHTSKDFLYKQFVVLDKSLNDQNILNYQSSKNYKIKKIKNVVFNVNNSLLPLNFHLNPRNFGKIVLNRVSKNNKIVKFCYKDLNEKKIELSKFKKYAYKKNMINHIFSLEKLNNSLLKKTKKTGDLNILLNEKNLFLNEGRNNLKSKRSAFWSTTSLLNLGSQFDLVKKNHSKNKKTFILI